MKSLSPVGVRQLRQTLLRATIGAERFAADLRAQSFAKPAGTVALFFGNFAHDFHRFSAADLPASG